MISMGQVFPTMVPFAAADNFEDTPHAPVLKHLDCADAETQRSRSKRSIRSDRRLQDFLKSQSFSENVNEPRVMGGRLIFPLHIAARLGYHEIVDLLIKADAQVDMKNSSGHTALEVALMSDRSGSHQLVVHRLTTQVLSARQAAHIMGTKEA